jgi:hypothetical protein
VPNIPPRPEGPSPPSPPQLQTYSRSYSQFLDVTVNFLMLQRPSVNGFKRGGGLSDTDDLLRALHPRYFIGWGWLLIHLGFPNPAKSSRTQHRLNIDRNCDTKVHGLVSGPEGHFGGVLGSILHLIFLQFYPRICTPALLFSLWMPDFKHFLVHFLYVGGLIAIPGTVTSP